MNETIAPAGAPPHEQPLERPIETEAQDRFGRAAFVRRVATGLIGRDGKKARGVVVGVVGAWGSGKSSVLNLLAADLAQREPKPVLVRFDPWLISGRDDLVLALLAEMHAALAAAPGLKEKAGQFLDAASPYISVLGRLGGAFVPGFSNTVDKGVEVIRERMKGPSGLQELKSAVARTLQDVPVPVVVLIDELDRLRDDEVRTVAQLVRAVADFPHVSYVLAYDQRRVEEALGSDLHHRLCRQCARHRQCLAVHGVSALGPITPACWAGSAYLSGYELEFRPASVAAWQGYGGALSATAASIATSEPTAFRLRAVARSGAVSGWQEAAIPGGVTALAALGIAGGVRLSGILPPEVVRLQVFEASSANLAQAVKLASEPTALPWDRTGLSAGQARWYWLRSVSAEGNVSALIGPVTATAI